MKKKRRTAESKATKRLRGFAPSGYCITEGCHRSRPIRSNWEVVPEGVNVTERHHRCHWCFLAKYAEWTRIEASKPLEVSELKKLTRKELSQIGKCDICNRRVGIIVRGISYRKADIRRAKDMESYSVCDNCYEENIAPRKDKLARS